MSRSPFAVPMTDIRIAPSILSADFRNLEKEIRAADDAGADRIHCDVMDGHFVPNITFGPLVVSSARNCTTLPLDVHLMISNPEKYVEAFCKAGADILIVHADACEDLQNTLKHIRSLGVKAGICVNPDKPVDLFLPVLEAVDQVLIMTVYAGFGGQSFIPETMEKVRAVREEISKRSLSVDVEVDGGINHETIGEAWRAGANVFVAGSYVFGGDDYRERIQRLRKGIDA